MGRKKQVRKAEPPSKSRIRWPRWTGFRNKTVWDFLQLLIVPLMLAAIGFWFTTQQDARQQELENQRAQAELKLAVQRAQDEALQAYLDQMSSLLLEKDLRASEEESEVRTLARARTLTVLGRLDPSRKTQVMQFLVEAELVQRGEGGREPIITLTGANLREVTLLNANLSDANLYNADLSDAFLYDADLSDVTLLNANLSGANLITANLSGANLYNAQLGAAYLSGADLGGANLRVANLNTTNLSRANLGGADLSYANLSDANLSDATLSYADLSDARGVTEEQLEEHAKTLEGATMPNGQKYEDWLKDREESQQDE